MAETKAPVAVDIATKVSEILKDNTPVVNGIIERKVNAEYKKREDILFDALQKRDELEKALLKVDRPDNVLYGDEGDEPVSQTYTKQRKDDIKKAKENLKKMDEALANAINNGNFEPLVKLSKGGGGDQK